MSIQIGRIYNSWKVLGKVGGGKYPKFLCVCVCGNEENVFLSNLHSGRSKSCGCKEYETKHNGLAKEEPALCRLWYAIRNRCNNKHYRHYGDYGGRGIKVFGGWDDLASFVKYMKNNLGYKPSPEYSLDRIDNDKDYEPDNIRWATHKQQMNNTRNTNLLTPSKLAELTGYSKERIRQMSGISKSKGTCSLLDDYIESKSSIGKSIKVIFKDSAIDFLLRRKRM